MLKNKENRKVFASLIVLQLVPFIYTFVRTAIINKLPDTSSVNILGQIEWFDLIDETLQAFLIVPIYAVINRLKAQKDDMDFNRTLTLTGLVSVCLYSLFSVIVMFYAAHLAEAMEVPDLSATVTYLRLETIGFILGIVSSFANVVFVILGRSAFIYGITIVTAVSRVIGDTLLIPRFGVNGVAYSNILVNAGVSLFCLIVLAKEKHITFSFGSNFIKNTLKNFARIGLFSGGEIFLNNLIYASMICKMVNEVQSQGIYWQANNFIWGFLLIPINALAEIIKQEADMDYHFEETKNYMKLIGIITGVWILSVPIDIVLLNAMNSDEGVGKIILIMMPFYVVYGLSQVISSQFTGMGKTHYNLLVSVIVNLGYYGIWFALFKAGMIKPSLMMICMEFGFGMVVGLIIDFIIVLRLKKISVNQIQAK